MPARLEDHVGYWMRAVSNLVSGAFGRSLAERGISVPEWVVLRLLFDAPAPPSQLAAEIGMTRGAMTKILDRLELRGLTERALETGHDRRFRAASLTSAGSALVPELAAVADANDAAFFGHLGPEERGRIEDLLRDILARHGETRRPVE